MSNVAEAAYLAGFLDGEGTISVRKYYNNFRLELSVANTHLPTLESIKSLYGGRILQRKEAYRRKILYELRWSASSAAKVLKSIEPYLITKKEHCTIALQFQGMMHLRTAGQLKLTPYELEGRAKLCAESSSLNKRGSS